MRIRHRIALAVAACAVLAHASCSGLLYRDPKVLVNSLPADPTTLNPITASDAYSSDVDRYIYESMLERDNKTLELVPKLAESWEIAPDHLTYTFHLRRDVKWQDGVPLTADDVVYTFDRILDPKVDAARLRNYYRDVKEIDKLDDYTIRFLYARPYFRALEMIGGVAIIPKHLYDDGQDFNSHSANRAPMGSGPYRFVEWKTGRHIVLTRNDSYWGELPAITGIVFKVIPDSTVSFQLLKKGAVDVGSMRAIQWVRQTEGPSFKGKFTKHRYYLPNYSYIGWNMRSPLFSDRRVRTAMTMMLNRKEILDKILLGQGEVIASLFYKFGEQVDPKIEPVPYDPAGARKLLAEAGWKDTDRDGVLDKDGVPFRFELLSAAGSSTARSISLFMKEDLAKMGIEMEIRQLEWATMIKLLNERKFDAAMLAWSMGLIQDPYQLWHSSQAAEGSNFVGFDDPRADTLIEEARQEFDDAKRNEMYREFQWIVHEEQPYTFMYSSPSLVAVAKRFENVVDYRLGLDPLEWKVGPWPKLIEW